MNPQVTRTPAATGAADHAVATTLAGRRLPDWAPRTLAGLSVALGIALYAGGIQDRLGSIVIAALTYLGAQTTWSFAVEGRRHAVDRMATSLIHASFALAALPLASLLVTVVVKGLPGLDMDFLTLSMRNISPRAVGGGAGHAILGTIEQVLIAAAIAVPIGIAAAVYLVEYGRGRLRTAVSFLVDVMTGVPSIVAGLWVFTALVLAGGLERSGFAAAIALAILMLPVVIRTTEEMLRIVPDELREAAYALGVPKWVTILRVVLPTALGGIITGVMLAVARVAGETAPLLLTTFLTQSTNANPFAGPQAALPTYVWDQIASGTDASIARAWTGALVLILLVMSVYVTAKVLAARFAPRHR